MQCICYCFCYVFVIVIRYCIRYYCYRNSAFIELLGHRQFNVQFVVLAAYCRARAEAVSVILG